MITNIFLSFCPHRRGILELDKSTGLHDLGTIKWDIALCLFAVYVICYFSLWKGISTSGKVKQKNLKILNIIISLKEIINPEVFNI